MALLGLVGAVRARLGTLLVATIMSVAVRGLCTVARGGLSPLCPAVVSVLGATVGPMFGGRYRGPWDRAPKPGSSVSERDTFAALNLVLGTGVLGPPGWVKPDMAFSIQGERGEYDLLVEYDGEYWHRHHERRDLAKYPRDGYDFDVMRLRLQPLRRLRPADISVPSRVDATTCARLALLHLAHRPPPFLISEPLLERIGFYLQFCARPLGEDDIACGLCAELDHLLTKGLGPYPEGRGWLNESHPSLWDFMNRARELSESASKPRACGCLTRTSADGNNGRSTLCLRSSGDVTRSRSGITAFATSRLP